MRGGEGEVGAPVSPNQSTRKTARKPRGRPFANGPDPRRGHGKKGRSGRAPKAFTIWGRKLFEEGPVREGIAGILRDPDHDHYPQVLKTMLGYAYGPPEQKLNLTPQEPLVIQVVQE